MCSIYLFMLIILSHGIPSVCHGSGYPMVLNADQYIKVSRGNDSGGVAQCLSDRFLPTLWKTATSEQVVLSCQEPPEVRILLSLHIRSARQKKGASKLPVGDEMFYGIPALLIPPVSCSHQSAFSPEQLQMSSPGISWEQSCSSSNS